MNMKLELLEKLIHPITLETFFKEYWDTKPLHVSRNDLSYFDGIISKKDIDIWFQTNDVHFPEIDLFKMKRISPENWTYRGEKRWIKKEKVLQHLQQGHSILLNQCFGHFPSLTPLKNELEHQFKGRIDSYLVITEPQLQGFGIHEDQEQVFALQVTGEKQWYFYDTWFKYLKNDKVQGNWDDSPSQELVMKPGDFLYVPKNLRHSTRALDAGKSVSLSIVIDEFDGVAFLENIVKDAFVGTPDIRERLPLYHRTSKEDRKAYYQTIRDKFIEHLQRVDFDEVLEAMLAEKDRKDKTLSLFEESESTPKITLVSRVKRNKDIPYTLNQVDKVLLFKSRNYTAIYNGLLTMSFNYIVNQEEEFIVGKLPGMLTNKHRLVLVNELVRIGLLEYLGEEAINE